MIRRLSLSLALAATSLAGCTSTSWRSALSTPKNPTPIFSDPTVKHGKPETQDAIIAPLYNVLLEAHTGAGDLDGGDVASAKMRRYVAAGFALSDIYCARFFIKTDEAYRRRRFGRTLTNDVGTAVATILGLASAGQGIVTGVAAGVGFADSGWRNYDDSFVVSPDLSNVQSLVFAGQDNFRSRTLAKDATLPTDYATAQTAILRYANLCSFLGMKALFDQSAGEQRRVLNNGTEIVNKDGLAGLAPAPQKPAVGTPAAAQDAQSYAPLATTAIPSVAANAPRDPAADGAAAKP